jgi:hypothetical protein
MEDINYVQYPLFQPIELKLKWSTYFRYHVIVNYSTLDESPSGTKDYTLVLRCC